VALKGRRKRRSRADMEEEEEDTAEGAELRQTLCLRLVLLIKEIVTRDFGLWFLLS
jgi:hypothetical protein